jgi:hypothetical protein
LTFLPVFARKNGSFLRKGKRTFSGKNGGEKFERKEL